jgi:hypothetical protein
VLEVGFAGVDHDSLGICFQVVDGDFPVQFGLDTGDGGVAMDACLFDAV